jgi:hypothetical protein
MTPQITVMGELGDIFWDLPPWIIYSPGYDVGCSMYVANPTEVEKEYALMARLSSNETAISEEALPVFGYTWFKVAPGDFIRLYGAFRFDETDVDLAVLLVERETEEVTDSVSTRLIGPSVSALPPTWPGAPGATDTGFDWSSLLMMMLPVMMLGMVVPALTPEKKKKEESAAIPIGEERKLLPPGREG